MEGLALEEKGDMAQSEPWKCYFLPRTLPNLVKNMTRWFRAVRALDSPQTYNRYLL